MFGRPFVKHFAICYRSVVCLSCWSETLVHCGQTVGQINIKLGMQVGLGPGHIVLDRNPAPLVKKGQNLPIFGPYLLWPNGGWIKMPHGREVGLGSRDIVLDGDPAPLPKRGQSPQIFGPSVLWPNGWMDQDGTWHGGQPRSRPHCGRVDGDPAETPPQFSSHFYCGQTAGCFKMPLGMEVGLSSGDFMLDGDPAPSPKRGRSPQIFGPYLL